MSAWCCKGRRRLGSPNGLAEACWRCIWENAGTGVQGRPCQLDAGRASGAGTTSQMGWLTLHEQSHEFESWDPLIPSSPEGTLQKRMRPFAHIMHGTQAWTSK